MPGRSRYDRPPGHRRRVPRRAGAALNRAVTALYDEALRPHGLRVGQLNLLVAVARAGTARPGDLCRVLRMDKSTLSRDVDVMRRNGWLEVDDSADARARPLRLSAAATPCWRRSSRPGGRPRCRPARGSGTTGAEALLQMARRLRDDGTPGP